MFGKSSVVQIGTQSLDGLQPFAVVMQIIGMDRRLEDAFDFKYSLSIHCVEGHRDSMELQRFKEAASKLKERSADIEVSVEDFLSNVLMGMVSFLKL